MEEEKKIINLLYVCMHYRIQKEANAIGIIRKKRLFELLARLYHVERKFWHPVLREFEILKLFKTLNNKQIQVLECDIDLENTSKIYKMIGLY